MDVFIDRKKKVWIVDFNPFGDPSSGLLFEWKELEKLLNGAPISIRKIPANMRWEKKVVIVNLEYFTINF